MVEDVNSKSLYQIKNLLRVKRNQKACDLESWIEYLSYREEDCIYNLSRFLRSGLPLSEWYDSKQELIYSREQIERCKNDLRSHRESQTIRDSRNN